jgi:hypothetical protein
LAIPGNFTTLDETTHAEFTTMDKATHGDFTTLEDTTEVGTATSATESNYSTTMEPQIQPEVRQIMMTYAYI